MLKKKHDFVYSIMQDRIKEGMKVQEDTDLKYHFEIYPIDTSKDTFDMFYFPYMIHNYNEQDDSKELKNYIKTYTSKPIDSLLADETFLLMCIKYMQDHPEFFGKSMAGNFIWMEVPERNLYLVLYRGSQYDTLKTSYIVPISFYTEVAYDSIIMTPHVKSDTYSIQVNDVVLEKELNKMFTKACLMNYLTDDVVSLLTHLCSYIKAEYPRNVKSLLVSNKFELYLPTKKYYITFGIGSSNQKPEFMVRAEQSKLSYKKDIVFKKLFDIQEFSIKGGSIY